MYLCVSAIYPYTPYTPYTTYIITILEPYIYILPYTLYMTDIYVSVSVPYILIHIQCHIHIPSELGRKMRKKSGLSSLMEGFF